jgi:hypothetical protein
MALVLSVGALANLVSRRRAFTSRAVSSRAGGIVGGERFVTSQWVLMSAFGCSSSRRTTVSVLRHGIGTKRRSRDGRGTHNPESPDVDPQGNNDEPDGFYEKRNEADDRCCEADFRNKQPIIFEPLLQASQILAAPFRTHNDNRHHQNELGLRVPQERSERGVGCLSLFLHGVKIMPATDKPLLERVEDILDLHAFVSRNALEYCLSVPTARLP